MNPHEILTDNEFYEPETLKALFPQLTDIEMEQLQVLQALSYNLAFWQDLFVFENAVLALNGVKPEIGFMQGTNPSQIWYAIHLVHSAFPNREFTDEIKAYVRFMSNAHGVFIYPPELFTADENPLYASAKFISETTRPLKETAEDIQAGYLASINLYIRLKQDDEKFKVASDKKSEANYYEVPELEKEAGTGRDDNSHVWTWSDNYSTYFADNGRIWELNNLNSISNLTPIGGANPTTISVWYKHEAASGAPTGRHLVNWSNSSIRAITSSNSIQCSIAGSIVTFAGTISVGPWYHITVAYPTNIAMTSGTLYINGIVRGEVPIGGSYTNSTLRLGNSTLGAVSGPVKGYLNDLALWNTVLTSGEIRQLATAKFDYRKSYGNYNKQNNLVEYYLMGDGDYRAPLTNTIIPNLMNNSMYFYSPSGVIQFSGVTQ